MRNFLLDGVSTLTEIADKFQSAMENIVGPVLIVIGAAAAIFAIYLGVMYAKAEDANKRKEVQGRLIGAAIGVVIIVVGIILCYAIDWKNLVDSNKENLTTATSVIKAFL
ncbi:MAG: Mbov_0395 family pilin-like conjugal transfer protein [Christensenellales bacterium]